MNDVPSKGHSSKVAGVRRKLLEKVWGQWELNPGLPVQSTCVCPLGYSRTLYADGYRRINSVFVNVPTKGQGGAILPMEDTNPQELEKIENGTSRE